MSYFEKIDCPHEEKFGGGRWARMISEDFWISVVHRMTGFGYMEWETAVCRIRDDGDPLKFARGKWDDRICEIIQGDHRDELSATSERETTAWASKNCGYKNSFEIILSAIEDSP